MFYGAIVLKILLFWGWFWTLNPESETRLAVTSHLIHFPAVDSLFVILPSPAAASVLSREYG